LRAYEGVYQWQTNGFFICRNGPTSAARISCWHFDQSGEMRTYPTAEDRFFAGPSAAVETELRV